jgi:hypothetical protein
MATVVCVKFKYEEQVRRTIAATAEKDVQADKLVLKDQQGTIKGEIPLDRIESWWHEAE